MSGARRFEGKVGIVTGASSGIGRACALALAAEGAAVVAVARRRERLAETMSRIESLGARAVSVEGDVREEGTGGAAVRTAVERFGGLDALVNAAGVIGSGSIQDTTPAEWDRQLDVNLRSVYQLTRAATPALIERRGAIVNLSSVAGLRPYANLAAYCVSKAGLDQLTRCAALELAPHGVRVNAVNPGVVVTELHTVTNAVPDYPGFLERSKTTHPIGRVGKPEEVADVVLYLLAESSGWITGVTWSVDGGRALASAR